MKKSAMFRPFACAIILVLCATLVPSTAPVQAQVTVQTRDKTIEELFQECAGRIRKIVTDAQVRIERSRDAGVRKLERADAKNVSTDILQLVADRLKRPFPGMARSGVIRLNREMASSVFLLRKHKDYEPDFQNRLNDEVDEALFDLQQLVDDARTTLDETVVRLSDN